MPNFISVTIVGRIHIPDDKLSFCGQGARTIDDAANCLQDAFNDGVTTLDELVKDLDWTDGPIMTAIGRTSI